MFNCVFCGTEVKANFEITDKTAKAICDSCFAKGGRLPGSGWEVSVDSKGNPRKTKQGFLTRKIHLKIAIGILAVILVGFPLAGLFVNPAQSILIFLLYYAAIVVNRYYAGKRKK